MKTKLIIMAMCFLFPACLIPPEPEPDPDPEVYCEPLDLTCRGYYIQACLSLDSSWCAYKAGGSYFECYSCDPLICDSAAEDVVEYCYDF